MKQRKVKLEPCTTTRKLAHRWKIQNDEGRFAWARCTYCRKRRLFRKGWPSTMDQAKLRTQRKAEERKLQRKEKRDVQRNKKN